MGRAMDKQMQAEILRAATVAAMSVGRAQERLNRSAHRAILVRRLRMAEAESLGLIEGVAVLHDHLASHYGEDDAAIRRWPYAFAQVMGRPMPFDSDAPPSAQALWDWVNAPGASSEALCEAVSLSDMREVEQSLARHWPWVGNTPLLAGAYVAIAWQARAGCGVLGMVLGDLIADQGVGLSQGGVVALGLMLETVRWSRLVAALREPGLARAEFERRWHQCTLVWLRALTCGAAEVLRMDDMIDDWQRAVDLACQQRRRSSSLLPLCQLVAARPSTSVAQAAAALKVSRQAAARLIDQAEREGLVREVTHGTYLRRYCAIA